MVFSRFARAGALALLTLVVIEPLRADEGMWLYTAPPTSQLKQKYQFEPTQPWLDHLQKASVRFNTGGSGSFVSADGLVITNHHVGSDSLDKLGDEQHNYLRDGFYAKTREEELKCQDLELNVLMSIEDVTAAVNGAVKPGLKPEQATAARTAAIANLEKESKDKTGLRSDVVTLYQGGAYHLHRYKRYDDVRVVFAPEQQAAFFGGDPDNFEYPRFNLDICLFRVYENGQPATPPAFLKWSADGPTEKELVFVSGHPGATARQLTTAELTDQRNRIIPSLLEMYYRREVLLTSFAARSNENLRRSNDDIHGVQNNRKRYDGYLAALLDPEITETLQQREAKVRGALKTGEAKSAFERVAAAQAAQAKNGRMFQYYESERTLGKSYRASRGFAGMAFKYARLLVRAADERPKPNGERFEEFRDSGRESFELDLFSDSPIYDDYEKLRLTDSLNDLATEFGVDEPMVKTVLAGKSPAVRAQELIAGTKVKDVAFRKQMYEGGAAAVAAAKDPMMELARAIDATARGARKIYQEHTEAKQQAYAQIAAARFAAEGATNAPDATFTLRLSYGAVEGYEENGQRVAPFTDYAGLYQRATEHNNQPPFDLPPRWLDRKDRIKMETPYNFVCTADIIGGSSGSPVVNKAGEFVGIIFDGNIQSLALDIIYTNKQARAVSTHSAAIIEALRNVYDAGALADELTKSN
ncbi:MAG: S46 family peptidase [Chthoniobacterales bacterium]|nr:S46 family peptidase [Chthoniobacterales bacterium]